ncbi:MAG: hypothetical protein OXD31_19200 [Chloroflexi bacterium]|nr:hypothetical protein [Chloroflexota bacterium]
MLAHFTEAGRPPLYFTFSLDERADMEIEPTTESGVGTFVYRSIDTGRAWEIIDGYDEIDPNASRTTRQR